jgi:maltose/moltooligosaccharide transporter
MATDTTSEAYNTGANQVGEMFANYNLIAAIASFATIGKIYESNTLCRTCCGGLGLMSVYFITEPTVFTMEWLPMVGVGIAWASILSIPMPCYQAHCHLTKWAITWEFSTSLS